MKRDTKMNKQKFDLTTECFSSKFHFGYIAYLNYLNLTFVTLST